MEKEIIMGKFESKFDIYLNTEDPAIVRNMIDKYPFAGVCCNPQMVSRLGRPDFANIVKELREATGRENYLFRHRPMIMTALCGMRKQF